MIIEIIFVLIYSYVFSLLGNFISITSLNDVFKEYKKPSFYPPSYLFAIVWTILYILFGILIAKSDKNTKIIAFIVLTLTNLWTPITLYFNNLYISQIYIFFVLIMNLLLFYKINNNLKIYLMPQIIWIIFAWILLISYNNK